MKRYENISQLLYEYRKFIKRFHQNQMAELLGVDNRTYCNWEHNKHLSDNSIMDVAEITKIPFEVLLRLNHGYPTLYNIITRRYSNCPFDSDYVNKKIIREELFNTEEKGKIENLVRNRDIKDIFEFDKSLMNSLVKTEFEDVINKAIEKLPHLNLIIKDPLGYLSGHLICLPMNIEKYYQFEDGEIDENDINENDIITPSPEKPQLLHLFSFFAINSTYIYCLIKRIVYYLLTNVPKIHHPDTIISRYSVTNDGNELCRKLGMKILFLDYDKHSETKIDVLPHFFQFRISEIKWLKNYKDKIY
jgi:transcriptional regulator with XRE-family HTH domain